MRLLLPLIAFGLALPSHGARRSAKLKVRVERPQVVEGVIDEDKVHKRLVDREQTLRTCYERVMKNKKAKSGQVTLRFEVLTSGRVGELSVVKSDLDPGIAKCMIKRFKSLRMPRPGEKDDAILDVGIIYRQIYSSGQVPRRRR